VYNFVANEIQIPFLRLANHLLVGNGSLRRRIPIDHPPTAIDQPLVVKFDKNLLDSGGIRVVESIALARPIAATSDLFTLQKNDPAMLALPFQHSPQEFVATQIMACLVLGPAQMFLHRGLRSDSRMIHPW